MWPYSWTHVGTPSHLGHMDRVAATMPSQAHAGAAREAPNIGQWEGQDIPLVRPSSCIVKGGIPSSRRYLPTYLRRGTLLKQFPWLLVTDSAHPPATGNHTGNGGHTYTGRTGHTHRGSRRERRRTAHHHALTARRRPRPPQGPPHRHQKRTKARSQRPGLGTGTQRGHGTEAQAPREGSPTEAYPTDQPERHAQAPTARTQRDTHT